MKEDYRSYTKGSDVYGSIVILKSISLVLIAVITILLAYFTVKDYHMFDNATKAFGVPVFVLGTGLCIALFAVSVLIDFYILKRTTQIGVKLNRLAYIDKLTGIPNRYSCDLLFDSFNTPEKLTNIGFMVLRINNLVNVNAKAGHDNGNFLISEFSSILSDVGEKYGYVGRNGGNEFVILLENCDSSTTDLFLLDLTKRIHGYNELNVGDPMEIAYGRVLSSEIEALTMSEIVSNGYKRLREMPQVLS
ncbi:MAG: diguanylate cyclase [Butyrivibrio sp.]|nr:diguanylate cyclase [Butyrivibrio sp.]